MPSNKYSYIKLKPRRSLTNWIFVWRNVGSSFSCKRAFVETLKGGPKTVEGDFHCNLCGALASLEGAPEKVGGGV